MGGRLGFGDQVGSIGQNNPRVRVIVVKCESGILHNSSLLSSKVNFSRWRPVAILDLPHSILR